MEEEPTGVPNLQRLREQAKSLVKKHRAGDLDAATLLEAFHPSFEGRALSQIVRKPVRLCDVQLALARQNGFPSWPKMKAHADSDRGWVVPPSEEMDLARIDDPAYRSQLAARKGLPPTGATAVSRHGVHYRVVDHEFAMTSASLARAVDNRVAPAVEDLLPVIAISGVSQRLVDLYTEVSCCTSKELVFFDSVPGVHPASAAPGVHSVLTTYDPRYLAFLFDATDLHETILAHELGHIWIEMVEGCEDFRVPRSYADLPKVTQFELIQSFVLDLKVNALLEKRGFDLGVIDREYADAIREVAAHCTKGDIPRTPRAAAGLVNAVAAVMLDHRRWPTSAVRDLDTHFRAIRSGLPEVYRAAEAFVASVERHGVADSEAVRRAVDECAHASFQLTDDDFDPERDLIEASREEWLRDKHPEFLSGLPVSMKLKVFRLMAKQGVGPRVACRLTEISPGCLEIHVADASGRQPRPPSVTLCVPSPPTRELPRQRHAPQGQQPLPMPDHRRPWAPGAVPLGLADVAQPNSAIVPVPWGTKGIRFVPAVPPIPRRYMPGVARWLSRDGFELQESEQPYAYTNQSPVMNVDPSGGVSVSSTHWGSHAGANDPVANCRATWGFVDNRTRPRCSCAGNHSYTPELMLCLLWQESNWGPRSSPGEGAGNLTRSAFDQLKTVRKCGWISKFTDYADFKRRATDEEKVWAAQDYLGCEGIKKYGPPSGYPTHEIKQCEACIQSGLHSVGVAQDYPCDVAPCCARHFVHR